MTKIAPRHLSVVALLVLAAAPCPAKADDPHPGAATYQKRCASCHGADGAGTAEFPRPLEGDRSVAQLSRLIAKTMPEDDPGTCVGEEADQVAAYIHDAFYSPLARARNRPARVELSRLTVRQYANAVADLIGSFRQAPERPGDAQGLHAAYFKSRRMRDAEKVIDRVDPAIRFDFGTSAPAPEGFDPKEFAIRWDGSILPPDTGEYEFLVHSDHAMKLFVNDPRKPLIDATVRSGSDTEYRATIHLLGGRRVPIRLEFTKAKPGVDDSKDKKEQEKPPAPASITLAWKPPGRVTGPIPERYLSPQNAPMVYALETHFPPDDRSVGYERGTAISKAWDQATTEAAIEVAGYVVDRLPELAGARDDAGDRPGKIREFAARFVERAFRRPLDDVQKATYIDRQFAEGRPPEEALKRTILLALKSPRFLYREVDRRDDAHEVASRLSFALWDGPPDRALLDAAASGKLAKPDQVEAQARRMADDPRARAKLREFFLQWLKVDQVHDIAKDPALYPGFDAEVVADLRTSLDLFLDDVIASPEADFRRLLLADDVYLNGRLAKFYAQEAPADAPFRRMPLDPDQRAGVLSHPYLMASFAYTGSTSPIHRGVFVARSVLGRGLKPPPVAVSPLAPDLHAGLSTRERVTLQTSPAACMTCHGMINPLGFGMERFDAVGRLRTEEKGKPIDASGSYDPPSGTPIPYDGARGLGKILAESDEVREAFVGQLFHFMVKQPIAAYSPQARAELARSFASSQSNIRELMISIAVLGQKPVAVASGASPATASRTDDSKPASPTNQ
ncbi:DUF1592 domain-containing protein [Tundrisphaera sp. TA3]|uniref:DUF1592 domain-containing protein n=1 Tax=Tundrisphaera sp. TA3 TaxID=3435775 RepID=UPI003EB716F7